MKIRKILGATVVATVALAGTAIAGFSPKFSLELSDLKKKGNPALDIHLEFSAEDEEIGNFMMDIPRGFNIAHDDDIADDEAIGGGSVVIEAGPACRPGPEGGIPVSAPVTLDATIYERARTDAEADSGVHAVWLLDLEPLNRVRLLVTGSAKKGWHVEGAPTPSDNTCNPLTVDLTINDKSESGTPIVTNPKKKGKYTVIAKIVSQDSPAISTFKEKFKIK